ncbi:hypothetical protein [Nocardioides sp. TF02-7]|uniref:hypothetical protein n=1 Tax=Nocardioides sp. TF02-7 TaxID=2917724 RepID=UPI001F0517E2|nr:hypothetical protein [Nocardioides sp. TF02-7]UMG93574.1 hypothetical protein MF408_05115 [Nocardioides sp. TF02-7]
MPSRRASSRRPSRTARTSRSTSTATAGVKVESSDGTFEVGDDVALPDDFPSDVPLLDGQLISASSSPADSGSEGWYLLMNVEGDPDDLFADATGELESAGFSADGESFGGAGSWSSADWTVTLTVADGGGGLTSVQYVVAPALT